MKKGKEKIDFQDNLSNGVNWMKIDPAYMFSSTLAY